jgi:beta-barrel assembly-enhancing protease
MEYMTRAGYEPEGMVGLMDILRGLSREKAGAIEMMFATHPMSEERYQTAVSAARSGAYAGRRGVLNKERYMDRTAGLRRIKGAIDEMQKGDASMLAAKFDEARSHYAAALDQAPDDYVALLSMAKCCLAMKQPAEASRFAERAKAVYPREAQACHVAGVADLERKRFETAHASFARYKELLPGNPNTLFLNGLALEGMNRREQAAREYAQYLRSVTEGESARHAHARLVEWGYRERPANAR